MTNVQRSLDYLEFVLEDHKSRDPDITYHLLVIAKELRDLRRACQAAYDWLEGAPIAELEAVEYAIGEFALMDVLEEALGYH